MRYGLLIIVLALLIIPSESYAVPQALQQGIDLTYNAKFDEAERIISGYIAANASDPRGYIVRGIMYDWKQTVLNLKGQLHNKSLEDFKKANQIAFLQWDKDQGNIDKMINLGNSHLFMAKKWLDLGKNTRAGLVLKKAQQYMYDATAKDSNRADAYLAMGIFNFYAANIPPGLKFIAGLLGISGNEAEGLAQLRKAASVPNLFQSDALFLLAYAMGQTKHNWGGGISYLKQLAAKYPSNYHFVFLMGEYAMRGKMYAESRGYFDQLQKTCQAQKCVKRYDFLRNYFLAISYMWEGNHGAIEPYVEQAEKLNENQFLDRNAYIHFMKGLVYKAKGKKKQAEQSFNEAIATKGGNEEAKKLAKKELSSLL